MSEKTKAWMWMHEDGDEWESKVKLHAKLCYQKDPMHVTYPSADNKLAFDRVDTSIGLQHFVVFDTETKETKKAGPQKPSEVRLPPEAHRVYPWVKFQSENVHLMGDPNSEVKGQQRPCSKCTTSRFVNLPPSAAPAKRQR